MKLLAMCQDCRLYFNYHSRLGQDHLAFKYIRAWNLVFNPGEDNKREKICMENFQIYFPCA